MLIFTDPALVFVAVPKTGTTALEMALKGRADIVFARGRKHITAQRFHRRIAPFLAQTFGLRPDRFAVIRDPEEQLRSWYRYRARDARKGSEFSTEGISFDEFVREVISDDPRPFAGVGSQTGMLCGSRGQVLVHHLFAYERPVALLGFLESRFGTPVSLKNQNVSPPVPAELEPATISRLRAARQDEFDLYARVLEADGHLTTDLSGEE